MCGIFGYLNYGSAVKNNDLKDILKSLSYESTIRGTDATGIAFVTAKNSIEIQKAPKSAYSFKAKLPDTMPKAVIGHTRHTTQGSEKVNINNHPFQGKAGNIHFSLAHNGILYNDIELKLEYRLPNSKIQTDSYVAVQLIEREKQLNMTAIKNMAEAVQGSFCFTLLDNFNNLYIVKGDNPVTIIHNKRLKLYLYASTDKILATAIAKSSLLDYFTPTKRNSADVEYISLEDGDILKIDPRGKTTKTTFKQSVYGFGCYEGCYNWPFHGRGRRLNHEATYDIFNPSIKTSDINIKDDYIHDLESVAKSLGYSEDMIDFLLDEGLTLGEIEEYLYNDCLY